MEHTLENIRAAKVPDIVVVLGFAADAIRRRVALEATTVVLNEDYEEGMASSLRAGISALGAQTDAALIILADQPFVRATTLDAIIDRYQEAGAQIVIPMYRGFRGNPVLLDRSVFHEVMALDGDIGCRAIFGSHLEGIVKVLVDDIGILLDLDTKSDFTNFQRFQQGDADRSALFDAIDLQGRETLEPQGAFPSRDKIIIVGTEPVAIALARLARVLHFRVTVVDPVLRLSDLPDADDVVNILDFSHFPDASDCYVVIASRGRFDEEAVQEAFAAGLSYVALVASARRGKELRRRLQVLGFPSQQLATLRAPAGLNIGAKSAEEVALSILAEIVAVKRKSTVIQSPG